MRAFTSRRSRRRGCADHRGGGDIWSTADHFQFAFKSFTGDASLAARVSSITGSATTPKVGVMIRDALAPASRQVSTLTRPQADIRQARRASTGSSTTESSSGTFSVPCLALRIRRVGNVLSSWRSPDGFAWTQVSGNQTVTMGASVQVGLAVASLGSGESTATFDNISFTGGANVAPTIVNQPASLPGASSAALSVLGADEAGEENSTICKHGSPIPAAASSLPKSCPC